MQDTVVATVWVDPEHGSLPRKGVTYGRDGEVVATTLIPEVASFTGPQGEVVWLPAQVVQEVTAGGQTVEVVTTLDIEQTHINPVVTQSDFEIQFPAGTTVVDDTGDEVEVYQVASSLELIRIPNLEAYVRAEVEQNAVPESANSSANESSSRSFGVVAAGGSLALSILALMFIGRRGRR